MRDIIGILSMIAALPLAACGYPDFQFNGTTGTGGRGGQGATSTTTTSTTTSSSPTTSTATTSSTTSGTGGQGATSGATTTTGTGAQTTSSGTGGTGPACPVDHLLISNVRSRGPGGASDEFVELWNPTGQDVLLDPTWSIQGRKADVTAVTYTTRWTGALQTIHARGHFLIVGAGFADPVTPDDQLSNGITDAASLVLQQGVSTIDALCYFNDQVSKGTLESSILFYTCEGTPVSNPHDDMDDTDVDVSLARKAAHGVPECEDTDHNDNDFAPKAPSLPQSSTSP